MKLHFAGKFDGDVSKLPHREHPAGAVPFKEPDTPLKLALIVYPIGIAIIVLLLYPYLKLGLPYMTPAFEKMRTYLTVACVLVTMVPHEILHAVCFKGDVYIYSNFAHAQMFVAGTEDFGKWHFIGMNLFPAFVLGFIPFVVFLICPKLIALGLFGLINIGCGAGDYINVFNALTQMPKGAKTYLSENRSYWYMP